MANMAALAAARRAKGPTEIQNKKGHNPPAESCVFNASQETHHSVAKAAALLGIGRDNVRLISVNERYKINLEWNCGCD